MGYPVSHSRSPVIHRLFAAQTNQDIQYELLQVSPEKLETAVRQFQRTSGKGLNVTVPHKSEVVRLVDQLSERASTAGAVNTLTFKEGEILGRCGNSGRTSEPHIHIHHQRDDPKRFSGLAQGLPLTFRDIEGPSAPTGGVEKREDRIVLKGSSIRYVPSSTVGTAAALGPSL